MSENFISKENTTNLYKQITMMNELTNLSKQQKDFIVTQLIDTMKRTYKTLDLKKINEGNIENVKKQYNSIVTKQRKREAAINKPKSDQHKQNLSRARIGVSRGYCSWLVNNESRSNKIRQSKLGKPSLKKTAIIQLDKDNNIIQEFESYTSAKNTTKINGIANVLAGKTKTSGGYIWKYKNKLTKKCV